MAESEWKGNYICINNDNVRKRLIKIKKELKLLNLTDESVLGKLNESLEILRVMKRQGAHMERRLEQYVEALQDLGFQRVRKKKRR